MKPSGNKYNELPEILRYPRLMIHPDFYYSGFSRSILIPYPAFSESTSHLHDKVKTNMDISVRVHRVEA